MSARRMNWTLASLYWGSMADFSIYGPKMVLKVKLWTKCPHLGLPQDRELKEAGGMVHLCMAYINMLVFYC